MASKGLSIQNPDAIPHRNRRQLSSPVNRLTPGYGRGKTPQWNTFESMEIDFDIDDLSDDEDENEMDDMVMLNDYDSYGTFDSRTSKEFVNDNINDSVNFESNLEIIDEKKQDYTTQQDHTFSKQQQQQQKKPGPKLKKRSSGSMTVQIAPSQLFISNDKQDSNKPSMDKSAMSALPSHLSVDSDVIRDKPRFGVSASVPIRQMKHYQVEGLTIWSTHQEDLENLYEKYKQRRTKKRRKGNKNIKFKDMDDNPENDPYIDDMKSQFANYGGNDTPNTKISEQQQVRRYLIGEIIETEESYVKGLQTLLYEFIIPIFDQKLIKRKYKETITCNIPEILVFHLKFLEQLVEATSDGVEDQNEEQQEEEQQQESDEEPQPTTKAASPTTTKTTKKGSSSLASVFYELCNNAFVELYTNYIKEYQHILDVYAKYNKNKKLQKYLKNKRKEKKPLTNHLILPIQRVTRYLLLLQELKKKTPTDHIEYKELDAVLIKIVETVNIINERQREIENMSQCLQVQETMQNLNRNIVTKERKLIAQFLFRKKENQRGRQFFVFNDLIIICNLKLKVKTIIELRTCDIKRGDTNKFEFHLISIHHNTIYETDPDKFDDLDALYHIIDDNRSQIHRDTLESVGADEIAKLLKGTRSVSQGRMFRDQVSLKSQSSIDSTISLTDGTLHQSNDDEHGLYD